MPTTRDVLVDAAERIVRDRGIDALSIRALAAEANYGKSTVHSTVGGIGPLTDELARRARGDMTRAAVGHQPQAELDLDPGSAYERLAAWIIQNPHWAEVGFRPIAGRPLSPMLTHAVPEFAQALSEEDQEALVLMASDRMRSTLALIVHVGDRPYGGRLLEEAVQGIVKAFGDLVELRRAEREE